MKHRFTCDGCGATAYATAAWTLRHRPNLCLACTRTKNGWSCRICGSSDPRHPLSCPGGGAA